MRRVRIRMNPSSPGKLRRTTPKRTTPQRRPTAPTPDPPLYDDVFAQWCAALNPSGSVCDYAQLTRFPGHNRRVWTTLASPGDGHCFYHSVLCTLRRLRIHPELTPLDGREPRCTVAIREATLRRLRARLREYRQVETTTPPERFRAHVREQVAAIRNAASRLEDARANRGTSHWALDVEVQATASALDLCIAVWEDGTWTMCFPEPSGSDLADRAHCRHVVYITHVHGAHFDTLVPFIRPPTV